MVSVCLTSGDSDKLLSSVAVRLCIPTELPLLCVLGSTCHCRGDLFSSYASGYVVASLLFTWQNPGCPSTLPVPVPVPVQETPVPLTAQAGGIQQDDPASLHSHQSIWLIRKKRFSVLPSPPNPQPAPPHVHTHTGAPPQVHTQAHTSSITRMHTPQGTSVVFVVVPSALEQRGLNTGIF